MYRCGHLPPQSALLSHSVNSLLPKDESSAASSVFQIYCTLSLGGNVLHTSPPEFVIIHRNSRARLNTAVFSWGTCSGTWGEPWVVEQYVIASCTLQGVFLKHLVKVHLSQLEVISCISKAIIQ